MNFNGRMCLLAVAACFSASPATAATMVVADSVSEFSTVQGQNNWYYGYFNGSPTASKPFLTMNQFDPAVQAWKVDYTAPSPIYWTMLDALGGHPNSFTTSGGRTPAEHWATRRYVSEVAGVVNLSGVIADRDPFPGTSGIMTRILVDGDLVYTATLFDGAPLIQYSVDAVVGIGSTIDFALGPNGSDYADLTQFTATITVPEPATVALVALAAATLACTLRHPCSSPTQVRSRRPSQRIGVVEKS